MQGTLAMADVPVVILAGGKGTRLRPFTASFPKPLVPLGDMPILEVVLRQLAGKGFRHITLSLGHLAELIRAYVGARPWLQASLDIATIDEDRPSGTAGSLKRVPDLDRTFLAMNGDVLTNLDYADLVRAHKASGAILTIAVHRKEVCIDLGVLVSNGEGVLTGYLEKPSYTHEVSMGVYVYEPRVLEHIEDDKYLDFPSLVHKLLEAGEHVNLYRNDAFWLDIGRPADYAEAQDIFEREPERFGITRS
ncbi:MAG: NTP transferase domain-containing protein [Rhizobiales bacterium]|nr:NTP transferase domain-containing protein [Hyphomicrobiales bacterium]